MLSCSICSVFPLVNLSSHQQQDIGQPFPKARDFIGMISMTQFNLDGCCKDRSRIRIEPPCWAKALRIDATAVSSSGWVFNLGDSPTNNGYGRCSYYRQLSIL